MRIPFFAAFLILGACASASAWSRSERCKELEAGLASDSIEVFHQSLQGILNEHCSGLWPKVADLFVANKAASPIDAAEALSLSGQKEYGPLLMRAYYKAARRDQNMPFGPLGIRDAVLLACSDLPRGRNLHRTLQYIQSPPPLSDACVQELRRVSSANTDPDVEYCIMDLLQHAAASNAIDIIDRAYRTRKEVEVREMAVAALENLPLTVSLPLFQLALKDEADGVRFQAVRLLCGKSGREGGNKIVEELLKGQLKEETYQPTIDMIRRWNSER